MADNGTKLTAEKAFGCCGYRDGTTEGVDCLLVPGCTFNATTGQYSCPTCEITIRSKIDYAFKAAGGVGIFFSFTEVSALLLRLITIDQGPYFIFQLVAVACTIRFRSLVRSVTI